MLRQLLKHLKVIKVNSNTEILVSECLGMYMFPFILASNYCRTSSVSLLEQAPQ